MSGLLAAGPRDCRAAARSGDVTLDDRQRRRLVLAAGMFVLGFLLVGTSVTAQVGAHLTWYVVLSIVHVVSGITVLMLHGGERITATGIYALGQTVFVGLAGLYLASGRAQGGFDLHGRISASILAANTVIAVTLVLARSSRDRRPVRALAPTPPSHLLPRLGVVLVVAAGLARYVFAYTQVLRGVAWAGLVLLGLYIAHRFRSADSRAHHRLYVGALFVVALSVYDYFFFGGFGRVVIASLALTMLTLWNAHRPAWQHKWVLLLLVPTGLFVGSLFGQVRNDGDAGLGTAETSLGDVFREGEGIESVYQPLRFMGELVGVMQDPTRDVELQRGSSFATSAIFWVPRAWWEDKPVALGAVYARTLRARYAETGAYSIAATSHAEWLINFGWAGLALQVPFVTAGLYLLDGFLLRSAHRLTDDRYSHVRLGIAATLAGGLLQYEWNDSFSYVSRIGLFVSMLAALYVFWKFFRVRMGIARGSTWPAS